MRAEHCIEHNSLTDETFIGGSGEKVTLNADKLLNFMRVRLGESVAALFALPRFDQRRTAVSWFSSCQGTIVPFGDLDDAGQRLFLAGVAEIRRALLDLVVSLREGGEPPSGDRALYAQLIPLLLTFPEPVEYNFYRVGLAPVAVNWGMRKTGASEARDTLGPFIAAWNERLDLRERQSRELAAAAAREHSFLGRLTRAGARSGAVTVSLLWNDLNDLDLHVECPDGSRIGFDHKSACGGILDVDRNAHPQALTREPVENVVWSHRPDLAGSYVVVVHHFRQFDANPRSHFTVRLKVGGKTQFIEGEIAPHDWLRVARFVV